jgi:DEAD/DEAH box helicase domain-containing protein
MNGTVTELLELLRTDPDFIGNVTRWETIPARNGTYAELPGDILPGIRAGLAKRGITRLYSHQRRSYEEARAGRNVVVVTPTASGKTLSYNLPVLQTLLERPEARALYLFPTKALSQDQQAELNGVILEGKLPVKVCTYDGDTPQSLRVSARDTGRIVITNPDMLHSGVLPNHPKWITFLTNLAFIVIDEVHTYRGVFGSHVTNLIRRLKRITAFYGSHPVFICCSATIGNPLELAERVIEEPAVLVDENGAPSGEKHIILYNPPLVDAVQGIRRGTVLEAQRLCLKFLKAGIKTIVFARSRIRVELIASYINRLLENLYTDNSRLRVEPYRGGYLPNERREIEKGLRDGTIHGVVSTNALELGIDIGGLDAAILAGFPGSISSSWQQAGRAGRRNTVSVAVLIASVSPIDQYMIRHGEYFLSRPPESGRVDPDNLFILMDHLKCAVFELPFRENEGFPGPVDELLESLEEDGVVRRTGGSWYWADRSFPAEQISLRSATAENVVIIDVTKGRHEVIGEMDRPSAKELVFPNAVYLHRGAQYMVKELDLEEKRCYVESSTVNYYTDAVVKRDIKVLHEDRVTESAGLLTVIGDILVRSQVAKFKKIRFRTHENVGFGEISLPEEEMHTRSIVLVFSRGKGDTAAAADAFDAVPERLKPAVIARFGQLVRNVAPVFLLCEARDLGIAERLRDPHFGAPALYVYDSYPGGTGLAEGFLEKLTEILRAAYEVVSSCRCRDGCPSCVGPLDSEEIRLMNRTAEEADGRTDEPAHRTAPGTEDAGSRNPKKAVIGFLSRWLATESAARPAEPQPLRDGGSGADAVRRQ